uniref:Uncharacterized protein n=1 Tax=Anopheles albimanus TaxID=7167 RepID=A0A182FU12_ANOAL
MFFRAGETGTRVALNDSTVSEEAAWPYQRVSQQHHLHCHNTFCNNSPSSFSTTHSAASLFCFATSPTQEEEERERERHLASTAVRRQCRRDHRAQLRSQPPPQPSTSFPASGCALAPDPDRLAVSLASLSPTSPNSPSSSPPCSPPSSGEPTKQQSSRSLLWSAAWESFGRRTAAGGSGRRRAEPPGAATAATVTSPLLGRAAQRLKCPRARLNMQRQQYEHCHSQSIEMDVYDTEGKRR